MKKIIISIFLLTLLSHCPMIATLGVVTTGVGTGINQGSK
jgi:hypothetical protein